LQLEPENAQAWRSLGALYFQLKRKAFAVQCFEESLRLYPSDQRLREWLNNYKASP
jgi:cytochrome c-type biogenesis protein CcmH/NrfG